MYFAYSDWHKGYPDCGKKSQSPINLAADLETVVKVSSKQLYVAIPTSVYIVPYQVLRN